MTIKKELKKYVKPYKPLYINIVSVSSSGMTRKMKVFAIHKNKLINLNYLVHQLDPQYFTVDKNYNLIVKGCGMDMAFHLSYNIKKALYPKIDICDCKVQDYNLI